MSGRILVIGGVAGGMSAAARARRLDESADITVLEQGGFVSFANCGLPYHIAGRIEKESALLVTSVAKLRDRFNIDVRTGMRAERIDRERRQVEAVDVLTAQKRTFGYDKLILAVGASAIIPPMEKVRAKNVMTLRSMEDTQGLKKFLGGNNVMEACIVGAGFIGLEMAEALTDRGIRVALVEKAPQVLPPLDADMAVPIQQELEYKGVSVITGTGLKSLVGAGERVEAVELEDGRRISADLVLLSIGVRPNTDLAQSAGLKLGPTGAIAVNAFQQTSDPDIYAVGDATEVTHGVTHTASRIPLGGPANRQGRLAGTHAVESLARTEGSGAYMTDKSLPVMGTAIVGVFSLAAGITGLSERAAQGIKGLAFDVAYVTAGHHASYYPGATPVRVKLVYEVPTGRVLGAQAVGQNGVDKRLDVVATLLHFGGTVHDLASLDLAYAPQFGSAKDPLHMAAFVAINQLNGTSVATPTPPEGSLLLDVRTPEENARGSLPGAISIPLESLRQRHTELPRDRQIVVFCQVAQRGYFAERMLRQLGYNVLNLKGGYTLAAQLPLGRRLPDKK